MRFKARRWWKVAVAVLVAVGVVAGAFVGLPWLLRKTDEDDAEGRATAPITLVGERNDSLKILAQMWCKEVGEKKSDLVDALSQLRLDERVLRRLQTLESGAVAQRLLEEAERKVEADRIEVNRAERTLRSWRLTPEEIAEVKAEVEHLTDEMVPTETSDHRTWAEATVRSPIRGVILEQNVVPGDIVDKSIDLFKVADLTRLGVMVNVYEEDLPKLERFDPEARRWRVRLKADATVPPIGGGREGNVRVADAGCAARRRTPASRWR